MRAIRAKFHSSRGFTLTEVLVVVAIVAVLASLAVIPLTRWQRQLRQTELDSRAELLFVAAQNRLTALQAAGNSRAYATGEGVLKDKPMDMSEETYNDDNCLHYVTSQKKNEAGAAAAQILPADAVERSLWDDHWVIEYDPQGGSVYAVFYSEETLNYDPKEFDTLRYRNVRETAAKIGYYGGDRVGAVVTGTLSPVETWETGERLAVEIACATQGGAKLTFYATVSDGVHEKSFQLPSASSGIIYTAELVLDDLEEAGMRFSQQERLRGLSPGADLTVTITVHADNALIADKIITGRVNSLFARRKGDTADISCARHLQNLDQRSGVTGITKAVLKQDIDLGTQNWQFQSIVNTELRCFEGAVQENSRPVIYGLTATDSGAQPVGLFRQLENAELKNICLSDASVSGGGAVGALVGCVTGKVTVSECQVFLDTTKDLSMKVWIQGATVGGLVGQVAEGGTLIAKNSFAATVANGTTAAGGLVGHAAGTVDVSTCYADCYLSGGTVGGLIGTVESEKGAVSMENCYAAGFLRGNTAAGLVAGKATMTNAYTACAPWDEQGLTCATAAGDSTAENVYYLVGGTVNLGTQVSYTQWSAAEAADKLGDAFTMDNGGHTMPYNLQDGMGLDTYSYPRLEGLNHYGDWKAEFESGSLAYYEVYKVGEQISYGFYGGKLSTLDDKATVIGDGYGVIYDSDKATDSHSITINSKTVELRKLGSIEKDGKTYYLYALPQAYVHSSSAMEVGIGGRTFYCTPQLARSVTNTATLSGEMIVYIRTARQLYALSQCYDTYATLWRDAAKVSFVQERPIDYTVYDWKNYGAEGTAPTGQSPIGADGKAPFRINHTYNGNGHAIVGVQITATRQYMGLFGCNQGTLNEIVLVTTGEESPRLWLNGTNTAIYMGMLCGYNEGTVTRCVAAGYTLQLKGYSGSSVYAGGLIGFNAGTVTNSAASAPGISGTGYYAEIAVGGFVGFNRGQIQRCYVMADIQLPSVRGGSAAIAGFAGDNSGSIRRCYCATALTSAGAQTHGFCPRSGSVSQCYYVSDGIFDYAGNQKLYYYDQKDTYGIPVTGTMLETLTLSGFTEADRTDFHPHTGAEAYPYPTSLSFGQEAVHYGDWCVQLDVGDLGMFYWELEEGGTNDGYHFSFKGFEDGEVKDGQTLCTTHDDGGVITAYGYGYYWRSGSSEPTLHTGICNSEDGKVDDWKGLFVLGDENTSAAQALSRQMPGYSAKAYTTADDGLRLLSAGNANGVWVLEQGTRQYSYTLCPFFANAFCHGVNDALGKAGMEYEIRSVQQLQYLNWSVKEENGTTAGSAKDAVYYTETTVGSGTASSTTVSTNYRSFPYLQFTASLATAQQDSENVGHIPRAWRQSHDLNGARQDDAGNYSFQPIAGAEIAQKQSSNSYNLVLYTWFGGSYDGDNYYISNINITSKCYNVGLFGTTAGATVRNVVLYSDNGASVTRETASNDAATSYALGGLVGIAYEYQENVNGGKVSTISNCAIAGYTIRDNSCNRLCLGEAVVGGLVGVANVNLTNCSAVTDIVLNARYTGYAQYGNFLRVGGLVGGLRYQATNCYTGGSIKVSDAAAKNDATGQVTKEKSTFLYVGGIGGSGFSANFCNFSDSDRIVDGNPVYRNCYTYVELPAVKGTITGVALIGSVADRYANGPTVTVENCYYLEDIAKIDVSAAGKNKFEQKSLFDVLQTERNVTKMLRGDMSYLKEYLNADKAACNIVSLTGLSYEQMSNRIGKEGLITVTVTGGTASQTKEYSTFVSALNGGQETDGYSWVTVTEEDESGTQVDIHGRYSFPGSDAQLQGQDYPFPTVLRQKNVWGAPVSLHYGYWPKVGLFWSQGIVEMDLIADKKDGTVQCALALAGSGIHPAATESVRFAYSTEGVVTAKAVLAEKGWTVTLTGLKTGYTEVTATVGTYTARLTVTVTAELTAVTEPAQVELETGGKKQVVELVLKDRRGNALSDVTWWCGVENTAVATVPQASKDGTITLTSGNQPGETVMSVIAEYGGYSVTAMVGITVTEAKTNS